MATSDTAELCFPAAALMPGRGRGGSSDEHLIVSDFQLKRAWRIRSVKSGGLRGG